MDWSRTKTIFIMVFLVLDIFLLYQFLDKKDSTELESFSEATAEEQMKEEGITFPSLPNEEIKENILIAKRKEFSKEDTSKLKNQQVSINDETTLVATLDESIIVNKEFKPSELAEFLKENIYQGESYKFWSLDEASNSIVYYQSFGNKTFYNNTNAKLTFRLNENREIVSYEQTYLKDIESMNKKETVITANQAIVTLFDKGYLPENSKISKDDVKLGYYNLLKSSSASYLLTPTWWIRVNDKDMFVKAFDGEVIELDTEEKILLE
ncbi:two-component system regulatory protein YycI [Bacillus sp. V59.32b]|uniref:two-component system regulatory protein YycI n=1 Tax=Bacillus sp. V59.32b TaxID=1758642 RepID=UPI00135CECEC|nr:two-component system regulatory protein YycI [Bacillus sp. V59.32b]